MRVFETKAFARFRRKVGILEEELLEAVSRAGRGQVDADLGGGVIKQRIARRGGGRSGGYRTLIVFRAGDRAVFVDVFAKNRKANASADEVADWKRLAAVLLNCRMQKLVELVKERGWREVSGDAEEE